jgi:hypothetical protein
MPRARGREPVLAIEGAIGTGLSVGGPRVLRPPQQPVAQLGWETTKGRAKGAAPIVCNLADSEPAKQGENALTAAHVGIGLQPEKGRAAVIGITVLQTDSIVVAQTEFAASTKTVPAE